MSCGRLKIVCTRSIYLDFDVNFLLPKMCTGSSISKRTGILREEVKLLFMYKGVVDVNVHLNVKTLDTGCWLFVAT